MPSCNTRYFETVEFTEDSVIRFPLGLPGFDDEHDFVFIDQCQHRPLVFLQSLTTPALCFVVLPVHAIDPEYVLNMRPEDLRVIGFKTQPSIGAEVFCGVILSANEQEPTANLLAPVVVRLQSRIAVQAIQAEAVYSHRHPVRSGEMIAAC